MIHKSSPGWLGIMGLCAALSAFAQEKPTDYSTRVPLTLSGEGPWYRLELPLTLQLNARQSDLSDVRVFNAAGEPQAYALAREQAQATQSNSLTDVKWFPLYNSADAPQATPSVRVQSSANGTLVEVSPSGQLPAGEKVLRGWLLDASAIKTPLQQLGPGLEPRARRLPALQHRGQRRLAALAGLGGGAGGAPIVCR